MFPWSHIKKLTCKNPTRHIFITGESISKEEKCLEICNERQEGKVFFSFFCHDHCQWELETDVQVGLGIQS